MVMEECYQLLAQTGFFPTLKIVNPITKPRADCAVKEREEKPGGRAPTSASYPNKGRGSLLRVRGEKEDFITEWG
jgi:hypothetical protein